MSTYSNLLRLASEIDRLSASHSTKVAFSPWGQKATKPSGPGWEKSGQHGYRRKKTGGGWDYWYPSASHAKADAEGHKTLSKWHKEEAVKTLGEAGSHAEESDAASQKAKHHKGEAERLGEKANALGPHSSAHKKVKEHVDAHIDHHVKSEMSKHKSDQAHQSAKRNTSKQEEHDEKAEAASQYAKKSESWWSKAKGILSA